MRTRRLLPPLLLLPFLGCDDGGLPSNADDAVAHYAAMVEANYQDAHAKAVALDAAIDALVASPSEATLAAARAAWIEARDPYLESEAYRFYGGPIDDIDDYVNAWPLNEAHLDYVEGNANAGLVNDPAFVIDATALEAANLPAGGGESDVAVGWHAIEFLLWGQDRSASGPGDRPYTDFVPGGTAANQARRGAVLALQSELLVGRLASLVDAWSGGGASYRAELESVGTDEALRRIFQGLLIFAGNELGGERLAALGSHDQEEEPSCFSDTTTNDMVRDARGIENVYLGRYVRTDGTTMTGVGLYDVLARVDPALADTIRDRIATTVALAEAIHAPFDQEIAGANAEGNARVQAFQLSLAQLKIHLGEAMTALALPLEPTE